MNKYIIQENTQLLKTRPNNSRKILNIRKKNNQELSVNDIRQIHKLVIAKNANKNSQLLFIAQGINRRYCLNNYGNDELNLLDEDEYSKGRVKDNSKFSDFFTLQIVISE